MKSSVAYSLICFAVVVGFICVKSQTTGENPCGYQIPCDNLQCIDREEWCDGKDDCYDKSDEEYCNTKFWYSITSVNSCTDKHFECSKGPCVPRSTVCDGYENCKDGSDEKDCEKSSEETTTEKYDNSIGSNWDNLSSSPNVDVFEDDFTEPNRSETEAPDTQTFTSYPTRERSSTTPWTTPSTTSFYQKRLMEDADRRRQRINYDTSRQQPYYTNGQYGNHQELYTDSRPFQYDRDFATTPNVLSPQETPFSRQSSTYEPPINVIATNTRSHYAVPMNGHRNYSPSASQPAENDRFRSPRNSYQPEHRHNVQRPDYVHLQRRPAYSPVQLTTRRPPYLQNDRNKSKAELPSIQFSRNYTYDFRFNYLDCTQRAENWLIGRRNSSDGWGEDTPRALIALSLVTNRFLLGDSENKLMVKNLKTHLGIKLLRILRDQRRNGNRQSNSLAVSDSRLAIYINALLATCQDPSQFLGYNLVAILLERLMSSLTRDIPVNPLVCLTLCLTGTQVPRNALQHLVRMLNPGDSDERSKDMQALALTALSCFQREERELGDRVKQAFDRLLRRRLDDGSFGSKYSTALAAQALMSVDTSTSWNAEKTMNYLVQQQAADGSFGDMLATYYTLPALKGRSLLHLRNTKCDPPPIEERTDPIDDLLNAPGPKYNIYYTLKVGYPETSSFTIILTLPVGTNFLLAMQVAERLNSRFKFIYNEIINGYIDVHTISGIPNDEERDYRWRLYVVDVSQQDTILHFNREYTENIRELIPRDNQEFVFWYLRSV